MITSCGALLSNAYSAEFMARLWPKTLMLATVNNPRDANCLTYVNFIFNYQCFLFRLRCFHRFHYLLENQFLSRLVLIFLSALLLLFVIVTWGFCNTGYGVVLFQIDQ